MGSYLNSGNAGFKTIVNGIYVDKTGMIDFINGTIRTPDKLTCVSRPRRFGKSFAAKMLCAYYDKSCDSRELFEGLEISGKPSFERYLNQLDVIYLDITKFISRAKGRKNLSDIVNDLQNCVIKELREAFPDCIDREETYLPDALLHVSQKQGKQFFVIIDEWDALFREAKSDDALLEEYIWLLRGLFKSGQDTDLTIAGAYMTGILPIKKYGTESALTDFREYTVTQPLKLAEYVGFTETEVRALCQTYSMDFEGMQTWYDGYSFPAIRHVYSPNSVMRAVQNARFGNYWTASETYESLKRYISMDMDGLRDAVIAMLGGEQIRVMIGKFQNDMTSFRSKDDILTLLIHLGYLAYDEETAKAYIPNLEVADAFRDTVEGDGWQEIGNAIRDSEELLESTWKGDGSAVAEALEKIHASSSSVLQYNNEASLSCAVTIAYYTASKDYMIIRELPAGKGFADLAFIPRKHTDRPAMIVELKYDKSVDAAIRQIKEKRYAGVLKDYKKDMLLVGINYDKDKKHTCMIEKVNLS